uniref:Uncharacterized protein n=1 Tax=Nicotiana tabacum TaxID=4097 RepID=A0A1S4BQP7_TOBAC|nr:PREDICTED: uncharacterized protein LOC107810878 [Nicotiana tabacum]
MAQMPDAVSQPKEWVEDLVSQRPYSEHAWMELSKGQWEARNHGLLKDVFMRPPSSDDDVPLESPAPRQGDKKRRKKSPRSPNSEKHKSKKRQARKPKEIISALPSDLIRQLRDDFEHEWGATTLHQARGVERKTGADTSPTEESSPKDALGATNLTESPQFSDAMINKAKSTASEDVTGLGDLLDPKKASILHHETFLRYREELAQHEAEVRELTEKRDTYKLLSEKLQAELEAARKEHAEWAEQKIEELQSKLNSVVSGQESLAKEFEAARSEVVVAKTKADAKGAQLKVDVEAIQAQAKSMVEHARWQAQREALEGVHDQIFDILAEIENAKVEEARVRKLSFPKEDSESLIEFEGGEDPEDEDAAPDEDQAT